MNKGTVALDKLNLSRLVTFVHRSDPSLNFALAVSDALPRTLVEDSRLYAPLTIRASIV